MITTLLTFALTSFLLSLSPGPDNLFVLNQSARYGYRAGIWATLGLCSGLLCHTCLVAFGVAALIQSSDYMLPALRFVGAGYLLYLAWQIVTTEDTASQIETGQAMSGLALYRKGVLMSISNPKLSIFFLAFLPQFVVPDAWPVVVQLLLFGLIFIVVALLVFTVIAWLGERLGKFLQNSPNYQRVLNVITASVFVLLAAHLLLAPFFSQVLAGND